MAKALSQVDTRHSGISSAHRMGCVKLHLALPCLALALGFIYISIVCGEESLNQDIVTVNTHVITICLP